MFSTYVVVTEEGIKPIKYAKAERPLTSRSIPRDRAQRHSHISSRPCGLLPSTTEYIPLPPPLSYHAGPEANVELLKETLEDTAIFCSYQFVLLLWLRFQVFQRHSLLPLLLTRVEQTPISIH